MQKFLSHFCVAYSLHTGKGSVNRIRKVSKSKERTVKDNGFYYSNSNFLNHFWITLETELRIFISKRNFINYWCRYNRNARKKGMEYVRMYVCTM